MPHLYTKLGQIHYHEYGLGDKLMFAFHGYGMTGKQFHVLENSFLKEYRIIGFDHFFHGNSKLHTDNKEYILQGMQKADVRLYIDAYFRVSDKERFSLLAYSIGANFALSLVEFFAPEIDTIILLAPDGLSAHKGFHFLRRNFIGKKLFRQLTYRNNLATGGLNMFKRMGLLDAALHKIAFNEMDTPKKRLDVYYTLNFIRHISPDVEKVAALINLHHIKSALIFGKDDALFPRRTGEKFIQLLNQKEVYEVPLGHWLITEELAAVFADKKG